MRRFPPERIVCLTEETVETLYLLGEEARIVGVSGYAVRPPQVRREKPRVSAFTSADLPKVLALEPDLVLTFSDLQAPIVADLVRAGVAVHAFNQRDLAGILAMIRTLGALVGAAERAAALADSYRRRLDAIRADRAGLPRQRVYFEEWDEPMISGIAWVSELVAVAGGEDVFADLSRQPAATGRIVTADAVVTAAPDLILASWCGKKVRPERIAARPGFA
ncbi:ABC transporter substrate-binding protein, partial [Amaricoccus sp.]